MDSIGGSERKQRLQGSTTKKGQINDLNLTLDISTLYLYGRYALSENTSIHLSMLSNLYKLLNMISDSVYIANKEAQTVKSFVLEVLKLKLENHITNRDSLLVAVYGPENDRYPTIPRESFTEVGIGEVEWIETSILNYINTVTVNNGVRVLQEACSNFISADPTQKVEMANNIKELNDQLHTLFRQNEMNTENEDDAFKLSDLHTNIEKIISRMNKPSYKLKTGIQAFNDILGGGLTPANCYVLFGLPGEGKTTTMINLLYQIKNVNRNYKCKDPTKRPAIVMLTMENKVQSLVNTFFSMISGGEKPLNEYTVDEAMRLFTTRGFAVDGHNPIEIIIIYKPVHSVDTNYCYHLIDTLNDQGYETIGFFLDYIMRIKPALWDKEERFRLGNVVNELCNLSKYYEIPVLTASQLNRDAARIIDKGRDDNRIELVNLVGRGNIGESIQIDQNADASIFLAPEYIVNEQGIVQKFLGIKLGKHRYPIHKDTTTSFYVPYRIGSEILMEIDVNGKRKTKKSLGNNEKIPWTEKYYGDATQKTYSSGININEIDRDINGNKITGVGNNNKGDLFIGGTVRSVNTPNTPTIPDEITIDSQEVVSPPEPVPSDSASPNSEVKDSDKSKDKPKKTKATSSSKTKGGSKTKSKGKNEPTELMSVFVDCGIAERNKVQTEPKEPTGLMSVFVDCGVAEKNKR